MVAANERVEARALSERVAIRVASSGSRVAIINVEEHRTDVTKRLAGSPHGAVALKRRSISVLQMSSSSVNPVLENARRCVADAGYDLVLIHPLDRVAVDYTGRISAESAGCITRTCKALAKDHDAATLLVCGMSRKSRWPALRDLPADSLEADADIVLLVDRRSTSKGDLTVVLAKNRHERLDPATQPYAAY